MAQGKRKRTSTVPEHSEHTDGADHTEMDEAPVAPLSECPFTVEYRSAAKKASLSANKAKKAKQAKQTAKKQKGAGGKTITGPPPKQELDQTLPEDMNSTVFTIKPKTKWDALKKYRNFVVGTENFALQEYIFVNHDNIPHGIDIANVDDHKFWVARVLEIRAVDEAHVYLRVYWLYWPEELPGGRQPYHGQKELIASNHMEIIDAMTVSGRANVKHWMELDEDEELPDLFWRQKFDYPTETLMEVREHCKCHSYYNPDLLMFGCPHCKTWLHEECIIADIKAKLHNRLLKPPISNSSPSIPAVDTIKTDPVKPATPDDEVTEPTESTEPAEPAEPEKVPSKTKGGRKSLLSSAVEAAAMVSSSPALTALTVNGKKGKGKEKNVRKPTRDVDQIFDITIKPDKTGATKAVIQDLRVKDGDENGIWEEDVLCLLCAGVVA